MIKLGPHEFAPRLPASYTERREITLAFATSPERASCAALGRCWVGPGKPAAKYEYEPLAYGGAVMDELVARGLPVPSILAAAGQAWRLVADGVLDLKVVEEAEKNSVAPKGA